MFLMGTRAGHTLAAGAVEAVREAEDPRQARALIADALPPAVLPALSVADLERIRLHLTDTPAPETGLGQRDYLGAACVFLLVFSCPFPVVLPFLVWQIRGSR